MKNGYYEEIYQGDYEDIKIFDDFDGNMINNLVQMRKIQARGSYINGKKQNEWSYFIDRPTFDGSKITGSTFELSHKITYDNDIKHGNVFDEDGSFIGYYYDGLKEGFWRQKKSEGLFVKGKKEGIWRYYELDNSYPFILNNVVYTGEYKNGLRIGQWYRYQDDKKNLLGEFINGKKHGKWIDRMNNIGQDYIEANYTNGILNGSYYESYQYDAYTKKGEYINGEKHGIWTSIDAIPEGTLKTIETYNNGVLIAQTEELHPIPNIIG